MDGGFDQGAYGGLGDGGYEPPKCECLRYELTYGPLTRAQADQLNAAKADAGSMLSSIAGTLAGVLVGRFNAKAGVTVATPVGLAYGSAFGRLTASFHSSDTVLLKVKACPSNSTDSGLDIEVDQIIVIPQQEGR